MALRPFAARAWATANAGSFDTALSARHETGRNPGLQTHERRSHPNACSATGFSEDRLPNARLTGGRSPRRQPRDNCARKRQQVAGAEHQPVLNGPVLGQRFRTTARCGHNRTSTSPPNRAVAHANKGSPDKDWLRSFSCGLPIHQCRAGFRDHFRGDAPFPGPARPTLGGIAQALGRRNAHQHGMRLEHLVEQRLGLVAP